MSVCVCLVDFVSMLVYVSHPTKYFHKGTSTNDILMEIKNSFLFFEVDVFVFLKCVAHVHLYQIDVCGQMSFSLHTPL